MWLIWLAFDSVTVQAGRPEVTQTYYRLVNETSKQSKFALIRDFSMSGRVHYFCRQTFRLGGLMGIFRRLYHAWKLRLWRSQHISLLELSRKCNVWTIHHHVLFPPASGCHLWHCRRQCCPVQKCLLTIRYHLNLLCRRLQQLAPFLIP